MMMILTLESFFCFFLFSSFKQILKEIVFIIINLVGLKLRLGLSFYSFCLKMGFYFRKSENKLEKSFSFANPFY